ncbi:glycosyltransferase family 2 protein [Saliterribacillus persicus]|uniref:Cellulose synthase/poly-beta-1,6-N-acetylglucosamine synthase-like glycosyltransferase n=1 Tax=Saliterribacillus persicus TaxID=930114 RepID=A0A368YEM9_9BACI|nr:glycosyltransferase family 2 protein [Saliterribacillus persicus]RCW77337.1 cellulose synthase/poly-beta-1,6-N-acetylglucosamine synthase-like glycosyltransferase [Saliterribacillus persicus]
MFLHITLGLFALFIVFQLLYILYPLFYVKKDPDQQELEKGISVIVPAYNEEKVILNCMQGILNLDYSNYEIIFVNDGSEDDTLKILIDNLEFEPTYRKLPAVKIPHEEVRDVYQSKKYPKIFLLDKENGGKADALNAGTEYAAKEIVVTLDADSVLDSASLKAISLNFQQEDVVAAGGLVQISQGFEGNFTNPTPTFRIPGLIRYQVIQYLTAFYLHKLTQARLKSIVVIAGAFGAFRKQALFDINGYRKTVGEDMDVTLRIHQLIKTNKKYKQSKLIFIPEAICYTECPATLRDLYGQRIRWQKAFVDCFFHFKKAFFRKLGIRLSIFFLVDALLLGTLNAFPIVIIPFMLLFNADNFMIALALFTITIFLASYQSTVMMIVSRRFGMHYSRINLIKVIFFIPFEIVTYRLLGLAFIITGTLMYFKNKDSWHVSRRVGNTNTFKPTPLTDKEAV